MKLQKVGYILSAIISLTLGACANMGSGPQGGPKDETAPKYISSTPTPDQTNFDGKKITLVFDEYVQLKDAYTKLMVSPPLNSTPSITSVGKKVTVEWEDTLKENTTYIFDFANSIADNNEGNEIDNFTISFSTGSNLDTMQIAGKVLNAENLAPMSGVYVGAYTEDIDSLIRTKKFDHVAKTDDEGNFRIKGLANRTYKIYALKDENSNYKFDVNSEAIGIVDMRQTPYRKEEVRLDTMFKDSVTPDNKTIRTEEIDTIIEKKIVKFGPDSLLIKTYVEKHHLQSFKSIKREEAGKIVVNVVSDDKKTPEVTLLGTRKKDWYVAEKSWTGDTTILWIKDTLLMAEDTIKVDVLYEKTDSLENFVEFRDTFDLLAPKQRKSRKRKEEYIEVNVQQYVEIYEKPKLTWERPTNIVDTSKIKVQRKVDTVWANVDFKIMPTDNPRIQELDMEMIQGEIYKITFDSASVKDVFGNELKSKLAKKFKQRKQEEYTTLTVTVNGIREPAYAELLTVSDVPVKKRKISGGKVKFEDVKPGDYFIRAVEDTDNDGMWTTGNLAEGKKPENVYYCDQKFTLRANWERDEQWDINTLPLDKQRSTEIVSKDKKKKKK